MIRVPGHFGEWLQGRMGEDGPMALVTLSCAALCASAAPPSQSGPGQFNPDLLHAFLANLGLDMDPLPDIHTDMPLGGGAGGSTAYLVALAKACGFKGQSQDLAQACLDTEGAVDPLMFAHPDRILWDPRRAMALADLQPPPMAQIIGGFGPAPVFTDPTDFEFDDISDLLQDWRRACDTGDLACAAQIASQSAAARAAQLGEPDAFSDLARDLGALGHVRAHTGSARGLIFPPGSDPQNATAALAEAGLNSIITFQTGAVT